MWAGIRYIDAVVNGKGVACGGKCFALKTAPVTSRGVPKCFGGCDCIVYCNQHEPKKQQLEAGIQVQVRAGDGKEGLRATSHSFCGGR